YVTGVYGISLTIYLNYVYYIYLLKTTFFNITTTNNSLTIHQLRVRLSQIDAFQDEMENIFSFIPFSWFTQLFISSACTVIYMTNMQLKLKLLDKIYTWINYFQYAIPALIFILIIDHFQSKIICSAKKCSL